MYASVASTCTARTSYTHARYHTCLTTTSIHFLLLVSHSQSSAFPIPLAPFFFISVLVCFYSSLPVSLLPSPRLPAFLGSCSPSPLPLLSLVTVTSLLHLSSVASLSQPPRDLSPYYFFSFFSPFPCICTSSSYSFL